jgi:MFS family permease
VPPVTAVAAPTQRSGNLDAAALVLANLISGLGNHLTMVVLPLYVFTTTGSAARTGFVAIFQMVPFVIGSFVGGGIVDRFGAKRLSVLSDLLSGLTIAAIPTIDAIGEVQLWHILLLAALGSLLDGPGVTARLALLPDVIARSTYGADQVNAAINGVDGVARIGGPILGGLLFAAIGAQRVLWVDAASFALSAALIALAVQARAEPQGDGTLLRDLRDGYRYLRNDHLLLRLTAIPLVANLTAVPLAAVIVPKLAIEEYGTARVSGLLIGADGLGVILGSAGFGLLAPRVARFRLWTLALVILVVPFLALAPAPPVPLAMLGMLCLGIGFGVLGSLGLGAVQERTIEEMRGRVFGLRVALIGTTAPVGVLAVGLALDAISVTAILLLLAGLNAALVAWWLLDRQFRGVSELRAAPAR